jgi:hypothetical protein
MILFRLILVAGAMTVAIAGLAAGSTGSAPAAKAASTKTFTDRLPASEHPVVSTARPALPQGLAMRGGKGDSLHAGAGRLAVAHR